MLDINRHINNFDSTFKRNVNIGPIKHISDNASNKLNAAYESYVNDNINEFKEEYIDSKIDEIFGRNQSLLKEFTGTVKKEMYEVYIGETVLPIAPEKIEIKNKNMNKTYELVNGSEFNILKEEGLKTISFECLLPTSVYPFALYKGGFKSPKEYIDELTELKENKISFKLKIIRGEPYDTNIEVSLEDLTIMEDANEGRDIMLKLTFKEFKPLEIKEIKKTETTAIPVPNSIGKSTISNNTANTNLVDSKPKAVVVKKRPVKKNFKVKQKKIKTKKNAVLTSRKYTGTPTKVGNIMVNGGVHSYLETLPAHTMID